MAHPDFGIVKPSRELRFREALRDLLEIRGFSRRRGEVAKAVFISHSALSQYLSGRAVPSLETLIRLSIFFNTSLDYLVFGTEFVEKETVDPGPVVGYVDSALADLQRRAANHAGLVARISTVLASQIDQAARGVVDELALVPVGGALSDSDGRQLEYFGELNRIVSKNMQYDVINIDGAPRAAGRYAIVVAKNLSIGRTYRFLLPAGFQDWGSVVGDYRRVLAARGVTDEALARRCLFRETTEALPVDFALHTLNVPALRQTAPIRYEYVRDVLGQDGCLGLVTPPSDDWNGFLVMDSVNREWASHIFDSIWASRATRPL